MFGRQHLHGCLASTSMIGAVRHEFASIPVAKDSDLIAELHSLLEELGVGNEAVPIAGAIPTSECYFATRPINSGGGNASARTLLRESLRSSSARLDQLAIDVLNWQADKRRLAGIVAAPQQRIDQIRQAVAATPHSLRRLEPAANALIRAAAENEKREKRDRLVTRVFLGETSLLGVMTKGTRAIHWQSMPLPPGDEATGIVSIARSVEAAYSACGLEEPPSEISVYGRKQLELLIDRQWLKNNLSDGFRWIEAPSMHSEDIAQACADGYLISDDDEFDFVREYREPLRIHNVVPYKEIAFYVAIACGLALLLMDRWQQTSAQHLALTSSAPK